jgi:uncharacterized protein YbaP (TraB family)
MKNKKVKITGAGFFIILLSSVAAFWSLGNNGDEPLKKSVIWKITGKDLPGPSYLFGTVHVADSIEFPMHGTIVEQLIRSEALVFETDLSEPGYQQKALKYAMMEKDSLDGILSVEQYDQLHSFFRDAFSFPLDAVKRMKPFYVASLIGTLNTNNQGISLEENLLRIAQEKGKLITGISSLEKDAEILSRISQPDQVDYLFDEIESYSSGCSDALKKEIFQAYQKADIERIYSLMSGSLKYHPEILENIFVERNVSWMGSMKKLMSEQSCFFAVGVGHLPGEKGLIRLLQKDGYKVVPVHLDFWFHD